MGSCLSAAYIYYPDHHTVVADIVSLRYDIHVSLLIGSYNVRCGLDNFYLKLYVWYDLVACGTPKAARTSRHS